jgi:hypothetical protein
MEPSYRWPEAYLAVPIEERHFRTIGGKDDCRVRDADDSHRRYFLRALLPIPIRGQLERCSWGIWVEVEEAAFGRVRELWDAADQQSEPPFAGELANALKGYDDTLGLPGSLSLTGPTTAPQFVLADHAGHPLAIEQREGVYPERVVEWLGQHCAS